MQEGDLIGLLMPEEALYQRIMFLYTKLWRMIAITALVFTYQRRYEINIYLTLTEAFLYTTVYCLNYGDFSHGCKLLACQILCILMTFYVKLTPLTWLVASCLMLNYVAYQFYIVETGYSYTAQVVARFVFKLAYKCLIYFELVKVYETDFKFLEYVYIVFLLYLIIYLYLLHFVHAFILVDFLLYGICLKCVACVVSHGFNLEQFMGIYIFTVGWIVLGTSNRHHSSLMYPRLTIIQPLVMDENNN